MKSNPPIKGHRLLYEGMIREGQVTRDFHGGCECGAKPEGWPHVSAYATKRWHRSHKAELRGEVGPWHNPPCPPQEEVEVFGVTQCLMPPADAPAVGSIWQAERSGRRIEVHAITETNGVWQVETESHPVRAIRTAYTLPDFHAMFTPAQTGDS